jgi:hypothetical protein
MNWRPVFMGERQHFGKSGGLGAKATLLGLAHRYPLLLTACFCHFARPHLSRLKAGTSKVQAGRRGPPGDG